VGCGISRLLHEAGVCIGSAKSNETSSDNVNCLYISPDVMGIDTLATMKQLDLLLNNEMYESVTILLYKHCSSAYSLVAHLSSTAYYGMA
jgi:hypothetical protein